MYTFPNQRVVVVHRDEAKVNFLGILNENWQAAARDLGAQALMLYLYIASNANNFKLALSPAAIRKAIGMPASTYRDQFLTLLDKGYLVQQGSGNYYNFYEVPKRDTRSSKNDMPDGSAYTGTVQKETTAVQERAPEDIEINNINGLLNNINKYGGEQAPHRSNKFTF